MSGRTTIGWRRVESADSFFLIEYVYAGSRRVGNLATSSHARRCEMNVPLLNLTRSILDVDVMARMTMPIWLPTIIIATALFAFVVVAQLEFCSDFIDTHLLESFCLALFAATLVAIVVGAARKRWGTALCSAFVLLSLVAAFYYTGPLIMHHQIKQSQELAVPIIAALEHYRTEHGRYPDQLHALVPGYVGAIPTPRLGLFSARPFGYGTESGDKFVLSFLAFASDVAIYESDTGTWLLISNDPFSSDRVQPL